MKKLFLILSVALFALGTVNAFAQEAAAAAEETAVAAETALAGDSMHHIMMQKFLEGGWEWMLPVLLCLVIGLAVAIERILYLSLATINSKKLIAAVEDALKNGGNEAAHKNWRNTPRPTPSAPGRVPRRPAPPHPRAAPVFDGGPLGGGPLGFTHACSSSPSSGCPGASNGFAGASSARSPMPVSWQQTNP